MSFESSVYNLINGSQFDDPRLRDALLQMSTDLYRIFNELHPPAGRTFGTTGATIVANNVTGFMITLFGNDAPNNVRLNWDAIDGINAFEIRYQFGTVGTWETASVILRTSTLSADLNPLTIPLVYGNHTFFIKAIDGDGNYSETATSAILNIPTIAPPVVSATVIGNFVLLKWTVPTSVLHISKYNVYKNTVLQGKMDGTFEAIFESAGGTFSYTLEAVDVVGNSSGQSSALVVTVSNPSDYTSYSTIVSTFTGTKTNCKIEGSYLLACIDTTKTYENHFIDNSWADPQAQVTAGYPIYIQPAKTTGSYVEVFDFGSIIANIIATIDWNTLPITGSVTVATSTVETSTDNVTWSTPVTGTSAFAASARYVRFTMNFVGADDKALAYFYNLRCLLNVHREVDSGNGTANSGDAGGTTFNLNKTFLAVESVVVTPKTTTAAFPVIDGTNLPTSFKVLVFNDAGTRVTKDISWVARGII